MKHLLCLVGRICKMFNVSLVILIVLIAICENTEALSQRAIQKPIEGDSLGFRGCMSFGIGYGSLDVNKLNETLKLSKLNTVESNTLMATLNLRMPLGKGFLLGIEGTNYFEVSSRIEDTNGAFSTSLSGYELGVNLGYFLIHNKLFMVIPSIGSSSGWNTTTVSFTSNKSTGPITFYDGIKTELLNQDLRQIEGTTTNLNLSFRMDAFLKLFTISTETQEMQGLPYRPINSENRTDMWIGGFACYNLWLNSNYTNGNIRFNPSGFNFGASIMFTFSSRLIVL